MSVVLSGIQPSGSLHIGHLVGALENFSALQKDNKVFYMIHFQIQSGRSHSAFRLRVGCNLFSRRHQSSFSFHFRPECCQRAFGTPIAVKYDYTPVLARAGPDV